MELIYANVAGFHKERADVFCHGYWMVFVAKQHGKALALVHGGAYEDSSDQSVLEKQMARYNINVGARKGNITYIWVASNK